MSDAPISVQASAQTRVRACGRACDGEEGQRGTGWRGAALSLHSDRALRGVNTTLLAVSTVFFALHYVHLKADFPNGSPWTDWAKFTDEGWYGDAAVRHYQLGHWNVPGDFNPAAALPVWPAMELALFHFTGVSLVAARALAVTVFGLVLVCCYLLLRRHCDAGPTIASPRRRSLAPAIAVTMLAVNPLCYALTRLALLEPLLILLTLAALLVVCPAAQASATLCSRGGTVKRSAALRVWVFSPAARWAAALGLFFPLIVLSKTTGIFVFPAILWLLWASTGYRVRQFLAVLLPAVGVGGAVWGAYYGLFVRPHYRADYLYLFSANAYTGITRTTLWPVLHDTVIDIAWMGDTFFALALCAVVGMLAMLCARRFRAGPLPAALLLWVFGYAGFLAYHDNLQPRYYLVLAVPLAMLIAIAFDTLLTAALLAAALRPGTGGPSSIKSFFQWITAVCSMALAFAVGGDARQTIFYVRHPEYTFATAADRIHGAIERETAAHPGQSPLVLSISGADLSLMTGMPSICDDFGTMTLPDRVAAFRPGWFVSWNDVEDDKMEALAPLYRLVRVAAFPAFDDPERNLLVLYRLDAVGTPGPAGRAGRRRSLLAPRRRRVTPGEQPSGLQLKH